jgi:hypothetical protein
LVRLFIVLVINALYALLLPPKVKAPVGVLNVPLLPDRSIAVDPLLVAPLITGAVKVFDASVWASVVKTNVSDPAVSGIVSVLFAPAGAVAERVVV